MTNDEGNPKPECRSDSSRAFTDFVIRASSFFRVSSFVIRHSFVIRVFNSFQIGLACEPHMNWIPYGPDALLFRFGDGVGTAALARQLGVVAELERHPPPGLVEFVPALTAILLEFDAKIVPQPAQVAAELLERFEAAATARLPDTPVTEVPVRYDGEDLEALARAKGMTVNEVCQSHCTPVYRVHMVGFSPGFPYLGDLDPRLHTPRRATPRPKVRAGSVAIGGAHTGVYTVDSPGGWHIVGHTPLRIFDPQRATAHGPEEAMFQFRVGDQVKFVRTD
jgi:inhibitor of KinA